MESCPRQDESERRCRLFWKAARKSSLTPRGVPECTQSPSRVSGPNPRLTGRERVAFGGVAGGHHAPVSELQIAVSGRRCCRYVRAPAVPGLAKRQPLSVRGKLIGYFCRVALREALRLARPVRADRVQPGSSRIGGPEHDWRKEWPMGVFGPGERRTPMMMRQAREEAHLAVGSAQEESQTHRQGRGRACCRRSRSQY